ncbi:hypothetical protein GCM10022206_77760 [Streptomyces chiangmaiensis]
MTPGSGGTDCEEPAVGSRGVGIPCDANSRKFYDRKRADGRRPVQAVLAVPSDAACRCGGLS